MVENKPAPIFLPETSLNGKALNVPHTEKYCHSRTRTWGLRVSSIFDFPSL